MAARLAGLVPDGFRPTSILELGCGTGHLTRALLGVLPDAVILATDLSEAMLERAREGAEPSTRLSWRRLDARCPLIPGRIFGLVASNALVQWLPDLEEHFRNCRNLTSPGGRLVVSGLCRDNFPELENILGRPPFDYPPGPGHAVEAAGEAAGKAGWEVEFLSGEEWPSTYPSARAFLGHLRDSGANRPPPPGKTLGRSGLRELVDRLEREAACPEGIRITWKPWFLVARTV
jgi:malonyl-CoA O-methyltransferase